MTLAAASRRVTAALVTGMIAITLLIPGLALEEAAAAPTCDEVGTRVPVVLVHGFNSGSSTWREGILGMQSALEGADNVQVIAFDYSRYATKWVTDPRIAGALAEEVACLGAQSAANGGAGKVVLVGHSMGGLAIRCALSRSCSGVSGAAAVVEQVITMGTPNLGSLVASLGTVSSDLLAARFPAITAFHALCGLATTVRETMDSLCAGTDFLFSPAMRALQPGSEELGDLPRFPANIRVHAIAGRTEMYTYFLGVPAGTYDIGDLIVSVESATAESTDSSIIDCGSLDLFVVPPTSLPTCNHITQPQDISFQAAARSVLDTYLGTLPLPPIILTAADVGGLVFGQTSTAEATERLDEAAQISGSCATFTEVGISLVVDSDGIVIGAAVFGESRIVTDRGLSYGDSEADLRAAYPEGLDEQVSSSDAYTINHTFDAGGNQHILYMVSDGAIIGIVAGDSQLRDEPCAGVPYGQPTEPPAQLAALWAEYLALNEICRGGPPAGVDPQVDQACADRDAVLEEQAYASAAAFLSAWQRGDGGGMAALTQSETAGVYKIPEDLLGLRPTELAFDCRYDVELSGTFGCYMGVEAPGQNFDVYLQWEIDTNRGWLVSSAAPDV